MTTLDVIETADTSVDILALSPDDRDLLIEQTFIKISDSVDNALSTLVSLGDSFNEQVERSVLLDKPTIPTLMLRKIVFCCRALQHLGFADTCSVITPNFKRFDKAEFIQGGAGGNKYAKRLNQNQRPVTKLEAVDGAEQVMFPFSVNAKCEDGTEYTLAVDEKFNMLGVEITQLTVPASTARWFKHMRWAGIIADTALFITTQDKVYTAKVGDIDSITAAYDYIIGILKCAYCSKSALFANQMLELTAPPTIVTPLSKHDGDLGRLASEILATTGVNIPSGVALWPTLCAIQFDGVFANAVADGVDSKSVRSAMALEQSKLARRQFARKQADTRVMLVKEISIWRAIISQKLGDATVAKVDKALELKPPNDPADVLLHLTAQERDAVKLERKRRQAFIEKVVNNKCAHVPIYLRLRKGGEDSHNDLNQLLEFSDTPIAKMNTTAQLKCKVCSEDLICPHLVDWMRGEKLPYRELIGKMQQYIDKRDRNDSYYCRICGELISTTEGLELPDSHSDNQDEELRNSIWGEIMSMLRLIKFSTMVNLSQVASAGRDLIYGYVFDVDQMVRKSKLSTADEIKNKVKFAIAIYSAAYIVHLVSSNQSSRTVSMTIPDFKAGKNIVADLIRYMITYLMSARNIVIKGIPGMSADTVKIKLVEAYKLVAGGGTQIVIYSDTEELDNVAQLLLDPTYWYIYTMWSINRSITAKEGPVKYMDELLGQRAAKISGWPWRGFKLTLGSKWNSALVQRDAFNLFLEYITPDDALFTKYVHVDAAIDGKFQYNAQFTQDFADYISKQVALLENEVAADNAAYLNSIYIMNGLNREANRRFAKQAVPLGRIYDEQGRPHKWNIYVTDSGELSLDDISNKRRAGETVVVTDRKCSVCNLLWSAVDSITDTKILESVRTKNLQANFFTYFEIRCPEGGSHEIVKGECSKCGYKLDKDPAYFKKYKGADKQPLEVESKPEYKYDVVLFEEYDKWSFNFNVLLNLAEKTGYNANAINCLGASEKQDIKLVQSGEYIPANAEDRLDTRIFTIRSHIKNLVLMWNKICGVMRLGKLGLDIISIFEAAGAHKGQYGDLVTGLTPLPNDWLPRIVYFQQQKKPREAVSFALQTYCELCLSILAQDDKRSANLRKEFIKYVLGGALKGDERLTKPGQFNWNILKGLDTERDVNYEEGEDEEDDPEDRNDPFKGLAELDIDDVDKDPDDDANTIKVGEEYGLD